jgi:hypothetical protein
LNAEASCCAESIHRISTEIRIRPFHGVGSIAGKGAVLDRNISGAAGADEDATTESATPIGAAVKRLSTVLTLAGSLPPFFAIDGFKDLGQDGQAVLRSGFVQG